jgi:hypothetical protein
MIRPPASPLSSSRRFSANPRLSTARPQHARRHRSLISPLPAQISQTPSSKPFAYTHFQKTPGGWVLLTAPFCHATPPTNPFPSYAYAQFPSLTACGRITPTPIPPLFFRRISFQRIYLSRSPKNIILKELSQKVCQGGNYSAPNTNDAPSVQQGSAHTLHGPRSTAPKHGNGYVTGCLTLATRHFPC